MPKIGRNPLQNQDITDMKVMSGKLAATADFLPISWLIQHMRGMGGDVRPPISGLSSPPGNYHGRSAPK